MRRIRKIFPSVEIFITFAPRCSADEKDKLKAAYTSLGKGIKFHNETGDLYISGFANNKTVLVEGEYKKVNSSALTIAKNELRKLLSTGKFTQYKVSNVNTMKLNSNTLEF